MMFFPIYIHFNISTQLIDLQHVLISTQYY